MADDIQELNALIKDFIKSAEGGAVPKVKPFLTGREDQSLRLIMDSGYRDPMTGRAINSYPSVEEAVSAAQARSDAIQYAKGGSIVERSNKHEPKAI